MKHVSTIALIAALVFIRVPYAAGEVYFFRDGNNTLHFTDSPPNSRYKIFFPKKHRKIRKAFRSGKDLKGRLSLKRHIDKTAKEFKVDPKLIDAVIRVESDYDPEAISPAGAVGLMQLMPGTAKDMGVVDSKDPYQNVTGGTKYLRLMLDTFKDDTALALAAYNAGPEPVKAYGKVPPFPETRRYVKKVMGLHRKNRITPKKLEIKNKIYRIVQKDGTLLITDTPPRLGIID